MICWMLRRLNSRSTMRLRRTQTNSAWMGLYAAQKWVARMAEREWRLVDEMAVEVVEMLALVKVFQMDGLSVVVMVERSAV